MLAPQMRPQTPTVWRHCRASQMQCGSGQRKKGQVVKELECSTTTTTRCTYCSQHCLHSISGNLRLLCGCRLCCLKAMATGYEFGHRANGAPVLALCTAYYVDAHKRVSCRRCLCLCLSLAKINSPATEVMAWPSTIVASTFCSSPPVACVFPCKAGVSDRGAIN